MKRIIFVAIMAFSLSVSAQTVKIAAAGNLRFILEEIKEKYAVLHPNTTVLLTMGSSGALFQQISNGASFDIYMAADILYPEKLKALGLVLGEVKTYGFGKLMLWSNTLDVSKGVEILTDKSVKRIAVAKPDIAPYGARAVEMLNYYNLFEVVKSKIVYADNIAQAGQFAQTGNAEVGILALALAFSPDMKGNYFVLDPKSYKPVEQAMVRLHSSSNNAESESFMTFVLSNNCKSVFEKYGFIVH